MTDQHLPGAMTVSYCLVHDIAPPDVMELEDGEYIDLDVRSEANILKVLIVGMPTVEEPEKDVPLPAGLWNEVIADMRHFVEKQFPPGALYPHKSATGQDMFIKEWIEDFGWYAKMKSPTLSDIEEIDALGRIVDSEGHPIVYAPDERFWDYRFGIGEFGVVDDELDDLNEEEHHERSQDQDRQHKIEAMERFAKMTPVAQAQEIGYEVSCRLSARFEWLSQDKDKILAPA